MKTPGILVLAFFATSLSLVNRVFGKQETRVPYDLSPQQIEDTLLPYLSSRGLTWRDVPFDVIHLVTKYTNKFLNHGSILIFAKEIVKSDFARIKEMILDHNENNKVYREFADHMISMGILDVLDRPSMMDSVLSRMISKLPNPFVLDFIEMNDSIRFVLLNEVYPEVMAAVLEMCDTNWRATTGGDYREDTIKFVPMENPGDGMKSMIKDYLGKSGIVLEDIPDGIGKLLDKAISLKMNSKDDIVVFRIMERDYETLQRMLVREGNMEYFKEIATNAKEFLEEDEAEFEETIAKLVEEIPDKTNTRLFSVTLENFVKYLIYREVYPDIAQAAVNVAWDFFHIKHNKLVKLEFKSLEEFLTYYDFPRNASEIPELTQWAKRVFLRIESSTNVPTYEMLDALEDFQEYWNQQAGKLLTFVKRNDFLEISDDWITIILDEIKPILKVMGVDGMEKLLDSLCLHIYDAKGLLEYRKAVELEALARIESGSSENLTNFEDILAWILSQVGAQSVTEFVMNWLGIRVEDLPSPLTKDVLDDISINRTGDSGYFLESMSIETRVSIYMILERMKPELEHDAMVLAAKDIARIQVFLMALRLLAFKMSLHPHDFWEVVETTGKYLQDNFLAPGLKILPVEEIIGYFNILARHPEAYKPFLKLKYSFYEDLMHTHFETPGEKRYSLVLRSVHDFIEEYIQDVLDWAQENKKKAEL